MFSPSHYIPVLRWKQAEWIALRELTSSQKSRMTPLIEFTPPKFAKLPTDKIQELLDEVRKSWGKRSIFFDLNLLPPNVSAGALRIINHLANNLDLSYIPVTGLTRTPDYQSEIREIIKNKKRVAFRIKVYEAKRENFRANIESLLSILNVDPNQVDLFIDYEIIEGNSLKLNDLCRLIPFLSDWATFLVISGAFPRDLSLLRPGIHTLDRSDWLFWSIETGKSLIRKPNFGDYAIQHPIYYPPPPRANFSASIRYASSRHWVIMRGEGVFHENSPGFAQYPANAQLLCGRDEFCGSEFSFGDDYIFEMGNQTEKVGSARTWLTAGINHHIAFVIEQLSSSFAI